MDLSFYISSILKKKQDLALPDFGYFYKKRHRSKINEQTGAIEPPRTYVHFRKYPNNDQVLIEYLSKSKNLPKTSAEYFVSKYTENIVDGLNASGRFEVKGVGEFILNQGVLEFHSGYDSSYDYDFYGLPNTDTIVNDFEHPSFEQEPDVADIHLPKEVVEEPTERVKPIDKIPGIELFDANGDFFGEKKVKKNYKAIKYLSLVLFLCLLLGGGYFIPHRLYEPYVDRLRNILLESLQNSKASRVKTIEPQKVAKQKPRVKLDTTVKAPSKAITPTSSSKTVTIASIQKSDVPVKPKIISRNVIEEPEEPLVSFKPARKVRQETIKVEIDEEETPVLPVVPAPARLVAKPSPSNTKVLNINKPIQIYNSMNKAADEEDVEEEITVPTPLIIPPAPVEKKTPPPVSMSVFSSANRYDIIWQSFNKREEAENSADRLLDEIDGVSVVYDKKKKLYRVCLGSYNDRIDAERDLRDLPRNISSKAWIMEVRTRKYNKR